MKTEQPLWGRGQMVSPQHFQQQAAYAAWTAECIARLGLSHPWGVIDATFEPDALKLGRLQARHLHVRFPDGTLIDTDNADSLPPVLSLESGSQEAVVVLALPLLRANGGNCLKPDEMAARPVRYRQSWQDVRNTFGDDSVYHAESGSTACEMLTGTTTCQPETGFSKEYSRKMTVSRPITNQLRVKSGHSVSGWMRWHSRFVCGLREVELRSLCRQSIFMT